MILTVTLNPSLDRTIEVASLEPGAVNRALRTRLDPGGKGVNVTRALLANGHDSRAVVPLGGPDGAQLLALLEAERVLVSSVPVAGHTRSNVTVAEPDGSVTKLNEPGASLTPAELETLTGLVLELSAPGDWVVLCGSLPPGVDEGEYAAMTRLLRGSGRRVAVDTSGPALRHAVEARPELVKPNREELTEVVGRELSCLADVLAAAHEIHERGVEHVLVSLGADGAALVGPGEGPDLVGTSFVADPRSTVGAGDAFLAGYLSALSTPADPSPGADGRALTLRTALAWGAAAVRLPGSVMPTPTDIDLSAAEILTAPDLQHPLAPAS